MLANLLIGGIVSGIVGFVGYKTHTVTKATAGVLIDESMTYLAFKAPGAPCGTEKDVSDKAQRV